MSLASICKKTFAVLLTATGTLGLLRAQTVYPPKVESPNAASLGKFGEVPVNLFTGVPDISIPVYTLNYGRISVPITLRYSPSSVKPSQQPGWVGSGWDLQSTGSITRQVRGQIDEWCVPSNTGTPTAPNEGWYYPFPGQTISPGSATANLSNWNTVAQLTYDFTFHQGQTPAIANMEVQADEFSFNFMGHSGKFYYEGPVKGWQVVSDEKIKVEVTGFMTPLDITAAIKQYTSVPTIPSYVVTSMYQSRMFGSFTLTTPDGTKYYFGGANTSGIFDAVDFSSPFMTQDPSGNGNATPQFTANTWMLKKIVDVNNNTIDFSYTRKFPTCNLNLGFYELNASCAQNGVSVAAFLFGGGFGVPMIGSSGTFSSDYVDLNKHSGLFQWPVYLQQISCLNEKISFTSSEAVCSKYTNAQIAYPDISSTNTYFYDDNMQVNTSPQYLNWEQLDRITVTNNLINTSASKYYPDTLKKYNFTYSNSTVQRLTLKTFSETDKLSNGFSMTQAFFYNSGTDMDLNTAGGNPIYYDGNYSDHWGFYNNTNIANARGTDLSTRKQPNPTYVTAGLLNKITYPTGGYTLLSWESGDYSQVVTLNRQGLNPLTGSGGGCRIKEIQGFLGDGSMVTDKKYYYKKNYTAGSNIATLTSSGVLNGIPQYSFSMTGRVGILGHTINNYQATAINGTSNYSYSGQGAPVGYDEVYEVNADGSYVKNLFTNYGPDLNGIPHWDVVPSAYLGWISGTDTYFPMTSLELERGKPIGIFNYTAGNILLSKVNYTYRSDPARFSGALNIIDLNASFGSADCTDALVLATARSVYNYAYYPTNRTVTTYDQLGNNGVVESYDFTYNGNNLASTKKLTNSNAELITTTYKYPNDYTDATSSNMVLANILTPVVQSTVINGAATQGVNYTPYTTPFTGIYEPQNLQVQVGPNASETRQQFAQYDNQGNLLETYKTGDVHDVYIWGYNGQYLVAKIRNSTYAAASALISQTLLTQAGSGNNGYTDAVVRTELNKLRTGLASALVTTYTYACGIGLTSETDPQGRTTFYEYDLFGRLQHIRDFNNNIIKKYCYNYTGQPESCLLYGNALSVIAYTKSCPVNQFGNTLNYTVPANKYTGYTQLAADQQAAAEQLANGQTTVNNTGICTPDVAVPVSVATGGPNPTRIESINFYQGSTWITGKTLYNTGGTIYVPPGTYTVTVSQTNAISRTVTMTGFAPQTGTTATFTGVVLSGSYFMGSISVN